MTEGQTHDYAVRLSEAAVATTGSALDAACILLHAVTWTLVSHFGVPTASKVMAEIGGQIAGDLSGLLDAKETRQ